MSNKALARIASDLFIFAGVFLLPWYAVLIVALPASVFFRTYREIVLLGAMFDLLYGTESSFLPVPAAFFVLSLAWYAAVSALRKHIRD